MENSVKLSNVKDFIINCSKEELRELIVLVNRRVKGERNEAKAQFSVGDLVTSDDPRWYYGPGVIVKIKQKNIVVNCDGTMVNASIGLLRHADKS